MTGRLRVWYAEFFLNPERCFFKEPKKAPALAGLDTCGRRQMFLMSYFCTG